MNETTSTTAGFTVALASLMAYSMMFFCALVCAMQECRRLVHLHHDVGVVDRRWDGVVPEADALIHDSKRAV